MAGAAEFNGVTVPNNFYFIKNQVIEKGCYPEWNKRGEATVRKEPIWRDAFLDFELSRRWWLSKKCPWSLRAGEAQQRPNFALDRGNRRKNAFVLLKPQPDAR